MSREALESPPQRCIAPGRTLRRWLATALLATACRPSAAPASSSATSTPAPASLDDLAFLIGGWETDTDAGRVTERWSRSDDGALVGRSETFAGDQRSFFEELRIELRDGAAIYLARPMGRTPAVEFRRSDDGTIANTVSFDNPTHDFPTRIVYRVDGDRLEASVEGGGRRESWSYTRASP
jgi:Domain of unknown function (DUF6265)